MILDPNAQVQAYRVILETENRVQQIDALVARVKHVLLSDTAQMLLPDAVAVLQEMRWQVKGILDQASELERAIGIQRVSLSNSTEPAAVDDAPTHSIRGSTHTIPIPDLVSLLSSQKKTGTLRIQTRHERFVLEFLEGAVVHAASDSPRPDQLLGEILVSSNKISTDRLDEFLDRYRVEDGRIGEVMTRAKLVSEEDLCDALEIQVRKLFERLFVLEDAQFCFNDGPVSDVELRVSLNTTQLLLEAARNEDEQSLRRAVDSDPDQEGADLARGIESWMFDKPADDEQDGAICDDEDYVEEDESEESLEFADEAVSQDDVDAVVETAEDAGATDGAGAEVVANAGENEAGDEGERKTDSQATAQAATAEATTDDESGGRDSDDDEEIAAEVMQALEAASPGDPSAPLDLSALPRFGEKLAEELAQAGIVTLGDLIEATDEALLEIPGIGDKKLAALRAFSRD